MVAYASHNVSMARGEVTPLAHARVDLEDYALGLATLSNCMVLRYGGVTRRPASLYQNPVKTAANATRFIRFLFNQTQAYALEFGDQYVRFHTTEGRVENVGVPVEVATPYLTADLWKIKTARIGDVIYIACDGYAPRTLTRSSETSWAMALHAFKDGPYLPRGVSTTMTPAGTGHAHDAMTSDSLPSPLDASSSFDDGSSHNAFDRDPETDAKISAGSSGFLRIDLGSVKVVDAYMIQAKAGNTPDDAPIAWRFEGSTDDTNWIVLDYKSQESDFSTGERRHYEITNETAYRYYRLSFDGGGGDDSTSTYIAQLALHQAASDQTAFNLTCSAITELNGGVGFLSTDVGRTIRLLGLDGGYRWCEIISYVSTTVVTVVMHGQVLDDVSAVAAWQMSVFNATDGWPRSVAVFEDRLTWAGTDLQPTSGWLSRTADYDNHGVTSPIQDDDGVDFTLIKGEIDVINWAVGGSDLILGTEGGIRVVTRNDQGLAFTRTNKREEGQTSDTSSAVDPVLVKRVMLFADKQNKTIHETVFSVDDGGYVVQELTMLAEHLFHGQIKEMHYATQPTRNLWVVLEDGSAVLCTYDRQQRVFGVSPVVIDGTFDSMCILPTSGYDVPMAIIKRTINGVTARYVEKFTDMYRSGGVSNYTIPIYLDSALRYEGVATGTVTGLSHLEGETLGCYVDAVDIGDAVVTAGSLTLPNGVTGVDILVGLRYTSTIKTLRPPNAGSSGELLGIPMRGVKVSVDVYETYGLQGGSPQEQALLRTEQDRASTPAVPLLHTGDLAVNTESSWDDKGLAVFHTDKAYPATIRALQVLLERTG